ncbi:zinc finger protein 40 isoform X1 [Hirundo rustica]|uniref:zinc finger protein 40 isoform X1 n=1 Tax=Hirundo rustica TaxID=43150 RepID=UPI001A949E6F|nr:zinc finger protein 40 isoform X1 [Hirundo rustica]XP_039914840.1 zinc finger protein 40 isoform X1 [Hirundo rustica]XP_039914849.1 zinc finger protein 40 isoform X1 [Hirundo rustica]XP_039914857.1 zinc finger protein 40 isoform X1 [Hirundo rustica]XP_058275985.1 zinc finger protein 40 isoform X1 [Hirundo rustica]
MPRTKQIHPRNLRDKIEEAQKQLNGTEDQQREITDAGTRGTQDAIKGVKRKKIVSENHLKKIPKSPLRSPAEAKVKQNVDSSPLKALPDASKHATAQDHLPVQNGNQCTKQNGGAFSSEISVETTKPEASIQTKLSLTHQSLDLCKQAVGDTDANQLNSAERKPPSNSSSSNTKTDSNECINFVDCSTSSPCTRTAFDVLLKAMEPELNTLAQECPPYGMQIEKLRPNKTVSTSSSLTSNTISVQNQSALSQQEFAAGPPYYPCTLNNVHVATTAKIGQAQGQSVSHSQDLITKTSQQNHQIVMCPSLTRSLVQQQSQENPKLQQIYSIAVTSSVVHTSSSTVTQVFSQNPLVASSSSPLSINTSSSTHLSIGPVYNSAQIASVVNHGVEQICNLLKDQKPKKLGKYVCEYCNRACAKPSVLQKHIRSHTGERPYPCVTCGFSFKTKSNLYKHKKSHAHAIKLGLVLQPDSGGLFLSHDSDKALSIHSDVEESGESEDEGTADERQDDQELEPAQLVKVISNAETLQKGSPIPLSNPDCIPGDTSLHDAEPQARAALPKVVVHPVNVSPLRADSPKVTEPAPELAAAQKKGDSKVTTLQSNLAHTASFKENDIKQHQKVEAGLLEEQPGSTGGPVHAQLQRQQATDGSQDQQGKCLLSPRSLGSTDSGYFSRSESADQTMSPPAPFVRGLLSSEKDPNKNLPCVPRASGVVASVVQTVCAEKNLILSGQMRPPLATKTLEERISKLISDNEAVVDDKQLDSVKPRRTSLSRRGSIDSPKSYIFKDSFQFDLKPMGRRTSSSSDIPKSPFTPTEKSKQVFLLSVPSLDCLPITRSNSMPTTSYSAVPPNVIPPSHPLRGSQSFDDKIGSLYDDVFVSGPAIPLNQAGHPRTLVRQAAIEDSSTGESQGLGPVRSVEESYLGCNLSNESLLQRSKSLAQGSNLEKAKKSPQVRGTMFECETCRNRYRKLENFENHKKFYCSELHGPKTKAAVREPEHKTAPNSTQPQILHYRVTTSTGVWEQTSQIRKRRKMKSVGDDDDPQQNDTSIPSKNTEGQSKPANSSSLSKHSTTTVVGPQQPSKLLLQNSQIQLVARGTDQTTEPKMAPLIEKQASSAVQEKAELKRQGTGISVIQHTNSLSRNSSFEKSESFERVSPVSSQEPNKAAKHRSLNTVVIQEDRLPHLSSPQRHQPLSSEPPRGEVQGSQLVSNERSAPLQPSRLVRQHNIQVPEILVTEEPDREQENQCIDPEKTERFNWPQRSETLSKLPTEKLPPKKKRIRLAEIEHSSAESSVDSTLSRSLSRESSLSHASSFSTSLDKDETLKAENPSKAEPVSKSSEFLMIPAGSHALAVPGPHYREMRRAASEQISCTQPSMEAVDYRSKSFDCGSMSPSKPLPLVEVATPKVSSANGAAGHVPLLERRRGPFVRQISLNITPENQPPQVKSTSSLQAAHAADVPTVPLHRLQTSGKSSVEFPSSTQHSQTNSRPHSAIQNCNPVSLSSSAQQPLDPMLNNQGQPSLTHQPSQPSTKTSAQGEQASTNSLSCQPDEKKDCFAPKYQLKVKTLHIGQPYSSKLLKNALSTQTGLSQVGVDQNASSFEVQTKLSHMSNPYSVPPLKEIVPNNCSSQVHQIPPFVVPVRIQSSMPSYGFATVTPLPHILVTQDQGNQSVSKTNVVTVPTLEGKTELPKSHKDHQRTSPNSFEFENSPPESGTRNSPLSSSLNIIQKVPVSGLFPQPEVTASSKRMLSPANSLDIAMEKQQKRVKDESGAACMTDARPLHSVNVRSNDTTSKQKKPVLVRQVCTTEPLENHLLDPDVVTQHEKGIKAGTSDLPDRQSSDTGVSETLKKSPESEDLKAFTSPVFVVRKSSELSPVNSQSSILKAVGSSQERRSPSNSEESTHISSPGQAKPVATLAVINAGEMQRLSFPSLKTTTNFTWCYLMKRKPLHLLQNDQKISAYSTWTISPNNPNPLGLSTKVALSLLNSKQKVEKPLYTLARTTHPRSDVLVYSSKWKNSLTKRALNRKKLTPTEFSNKENSESSTEHDKENSFIKTVPRRVKIFDGGYKSNEDYVYVRGRGRGKYICEECGIRCKKPSMLRKHIRTHTDVRPYHCNYCNFSFKTKGNLTKHMKSKAHSKKCMDLGVSVGLIDDQDGEEEFGEKQRFGYDRSGYDVEESDGGDEDENDNEDDDEDSQAESVLSTTPSVTASPQHHPSRHGLQDATSTDDDIRLPDCFTGAHTDSMDGLPKALLTKMTVLSTVQSVCRTSRSPAESTHQEAHEHKAQERGVGPCGASAALTDIAPASPGRQMSVDYPDPDTALGRSLVSTAALTKSTPSISSQSSPADRSMPTTAPSPYTEIPEEKPAAEPTAPQTHLFSHLPLHSQRQAKAPYGMVPVGGIQVVPAGLATYSTFVPIQAGPVQLTIPAVSVIHRTTSALGEAGGTAAGTTANPVGVAEVNSVVPCIPIGQVSVPGIQGLGTPSLQPLPPLGMETVNILGLANTNIAPQMRPPGITLNAVGLQVLTAGAAPQGNPSPQGHLPGLQILNIALPTLIPSVSPASADGHGASEAPTTGSKAGEVQLEPAPVGFPAAEVGQVGRDASPQAVAGGQRYGGKSHPEPTPLTNPSGPGKASPEKTDLVNPSKPKRDLPALQVKRAAPAEPRSKVNPNTLTKSPVHRTVTPDRQVPRPAAPPQRQNTVQFSDGSSDDEDRLVIAT